MPKTCPENANKICCGTCLHSEETKVEGHLDCSREGLDYPQIVEDFWSCDHWEPECGDWSRFV